MFMGNLHDGHRKPLSRALTRHENSLPLSLSGRCGDPPQKGRPGPGLGSRGGFPSKLINLIEIRQKTALWMTCDKTSDKIAID